MRSEPCSLQQPAGLLLVPVWISLVAGVCGFSIVGNWKAAVLYAAWCYGSDGSVVCFHRAVAFDAQVGVLLEKCDLAEYVKLELSETGQAQDHGLHTLRAPENPARCEVISQLI